MNKWSFTVTNVTDKMKIGTYLKSKLGLTSAMITSVKFGGVFLNGENVHMRALVSEGDKIDVILPDEKSEGIEAMDIPLDVLFEDEYILAVNKPCGMPTHPSKGNHLPTLANAVMGRYSGNFVFRAINRLDRDTSGVVLLAKDRFTAAKLSKYMREYHINKRYLAIVRGVPEPRCAIIEAPIKREAEDSIKRIVRPDGKYAKTEYRVMYQRDSESSVCEIILYTGRTHQIRVHMAHIGHPLVNDFLYDTNPSGETYKLHCSAITFTHPITEESITITAPADF